MKLRLTIAFCVYLLAAVVMTMVFVLLEESRDRSLFSGIGYWIRFLLACLLLHLAFFIVLKFVAKTDPWELVAGFVVSLGTGWVGMVFLFPFLQEWMGDFFAVTLIQLSATLISLRIIERPLNA